MERLTFYDDFGEPCYRIGGVVYKNEVSQRLAEYEETMLEPIEIIQFFDKEILPLTVEATIEAEPVKHGRWEIKTDTIFDIEKNILVCSECKTIWDYKMKYCPNCGSRMDLEE